MDKFLANCKLSCNGWVKFKLNFLRLPLWLWYDATMPTENISCMLLLICICVPIEVLPQKFYPQPASGSYMFYIYHTWPIPFFHWQHASLSLACMLVINTYWAEGIVACPSQQVHYTHIHTRHPIHINKRRNPDGSKVKCVVIKFLDNGKYLHYMREPPEIASFPARELFKDIINASGDDPASPCARFYPEPSKRNGGYYHIRCSYNDKYMVSRKVEGRVYLFCNAEEPVDILGSPSSTLLQLPYLRKKNRFCFLISILS